ncbi:MAG: 3-isopropylmalate dehydratase small subunit, partial [Pseudomonadota bacterium]
MDKFDTLTGIAAPMPLVNIDTDMIIPKQFLKTIKRSGLGVNLFDEMRYDRQGNEIEDFVLNQPQYRATEILVAGENFGCGSSREHAPWAI